MVLSAFSGYIVAVPILWTFSLSYMDPSENHNLGDH